ncbi:uncharacterized protein NECHADRAFT_85466 [Fusarium vanettenii 77-13-4]|uniref:DUF6594 domain-containing protein n=1 Tax=Fusarium vanettenii (strain ATCC MYA-4622 / CBS 123669 / FGSC 9596 / NRRL 45880 / 77-13-4) TaxID=660122 RepID=C7ZNP9_FUSV7|nr:uncharacterized protein NECHADRAFT_85466 [Fusarium vanettenii 77-13-4]EEU34028.1 hypothetical protein NECHADRAFT_85466 [Fusarium vanettenii 77-13-4]
MSQPKPAGYQKLAALMGRTNDLGVFRKFTRLNMLSLLSLQAELVELEADYGDICEDDVQGGEKFHLSFQELRNSREKPNSFQYEKLQEIRARLGEYMASLLDLKPPSKKNVAVLREWLNDAKGGDEFLQGLERSQWDTVVDSDLVALHKVADNEDVFARCFRKATIHIYHRLWGHKGHGGIVIDEESGMVEYSDTKVGQVSQAVSTTLASILPVLAVLGLYFEKNLLNRIYIMIGITTIFAAVLSVFSRVSRAEIFSATATFAAVEVVFIGSTS